MDSIKKSTDIDKVKTNYKLEKDAKNTDISEIKFYFIWYAIFPRYN